MNLKVYIAGQISGDENYKQKFAEAHMKLQNAGYTVLNPAVLPDGLSKGEYMKICLDMIDCADVVCLLPSWHYSKGACLEQAYCEYVGKPTLDYDSFFSRIKKIIKPTEQRAGCDFCVGRMSTTKKFAKIAINANQFIIPFDFCPKCGRKLYHGG